MSNDERRPKFQIIRKPRRVPPQEEQFREPVGQRMLFPLPKRDLLVFLVFPLVTEDEFTAALEMAKPVMILELRRSPRFDIGHLNRQEAFRWFEAMQAKYYDLSSAQISEEMDSADPVQLVQEFLSYSGSEVAGPIMLLLSDTSSTGNANESSLPTRIARLFASASKHPWKTVEIPQFA
jgi:hypothetical protein